MVNGDAMIRSGKILMKKFYLKIHPDIVQHRCQKAAAENNQSLQILNELFDNVTSGSSNRSRSQKFRLPFNVVSSKDSEISKFTAELKLEPSATEWQRMGLLFSELRPALYKAGLQKDLDLLLKQIGYSEPRSFKNEDPPKRNVKMEINPYEHFNPIDERVFGKAVNRIRKQFTKNIFQQDRVLLYTHIESPTEFLLKVKSLLEDHVKLECLSALNSSMAKDIQLVFGSNDYTLLGRRIHFPLDYEPIHAAQHIKRSIEQLENTAQSS